MALASENIKEDKSVILTSSKLTCGLEGDWAINYSALQIRKFGVISSIFWGPNVDGRLAEINFKTFPEFSLKSLGKEGAAQIGDHVLILDEKTSMRFLGQEIQ